jgi:DDE family transposase
METQAYFSKYASLVLMARRFEALQVWPLVGGEVTIPQKVLQHTPRDKLLDCLITMLMGGRGLVEINTRLRCDVAVQRAFGRQGCADQSTVSDTLNVCTMTQVIQLRRGIEYLLREHSVAMQQPPTPWRVLDVDMLGLPAGRQGEGVTKGYFSGGRDQYGRQLGRVLATACDEILVERLYAGTRQLEQSLIELVGAAERLLGLSENQRENTLLRVDAGGGTDDNIRQVLSRGYQVLTKAHSWQRGERLARSVHEWQTDPKTRQREVGWVTQPQPYGRDTRQLLVRTVTAKGQVRHRVLISTLADEQLCAACGLALPCGTPWPLLYAYDRRGGGIETQNRCDRQGLGLGRRNKHRFAAQEVLVLLEQVAHDFLIWMRNDLARVDQHLACYGLKRMVRDVLTIGGQIGIDAQRRVVGVELDPDHPLAASVNAAFNLPYV